MYRQQKQDNTIKEQNTTPVQTLRSMYRKQKQNKRTKEQCTTPDQTLG
jgi:hypothetical protein